MENPAYLGDGVYAFFDGNGIELRLNNHQNRCLIYLEPETTVALIRFWASRSRRETNMAGQRPSG